MMRRMRTRLPTYLSTGLGALVDISNTPREALWDEAKRIMPQAPIPSNPARKHRGRNADNLSNELPGPYLDSRDRMLPPRAVCQLWISGRRYFRRLTETNYERSFSRPAS